MKASLTDILARIPAAKTDKWPNGEPFADAFKHGTMSVEVFAPRGRDAQDPHDQDELYFVVGGSATFLREAERMAVTNGDVLFVPAGDLHHFEDMSEDFVTWVVFWGPKGGEAGA
jgi:mannose-6-phosphate isomerase-like protein (cupin superfamily)